MCVWWVLGYAGTYASCKESVRHPAHSLEMGSEPGAELVAASLSKHPVSIPHGAGVKVVFEMGARHVSSRPQACPAIARTH